MPRRNEGFAIFVKPAGVRAIAGKTATFVKKRKLNTKQMGLMASYFHMDENVGYIEKQLNVKVKCISINESMPKIDLD